ncbi:DUF3561 family protein [Pantoea sp. 1.19]|uniref:DUF3561 family protein n=1 Tax=Pantoea sp. 1.19 TaxID=1925589 RepID=UPI000948BBFC|nr:DUF3561 family protein [Pantoea sp. 1.19]
MQNVTPMLARREEREEDMPSRTFPGGVIGFACWWVALSTPFLLYGANTLFFFLYTWPFFLALLPVAVVTGVGMCLLLQGRLIWGGMATALIVTAMFWLLFLFLTVW